MKRLWTSRKKEKQATPGGEEAPWAKLKKFSDAAEGGGKKGVHLTNIVRDALNKREKRRIKVREMVEGRANLPLLLGERKV